MTTLRLYHPPFSRHLYRCRALTTYGEVLGERLYLSPSIEAAYTRFLRWLGLHRSHLLDLPFSTWWIDCDLQFRNWEVGASNASVIVSRYTDFRPWDSVIPF